MVRRRLNLRVVLYGVRELEERAGYLLAVARQISDTLVVALSRGDGPASRGRNFRGSPMTRGAPGSRRAPACVEARCAHKRGLRGVAGRPGRPCWPRRQKSHDSCLAPTPDREAPLVKSRGWCEPLVPCIASATTGLTVRAECDAGPDPTGIGVTDEAFHGLPLTRDAFHG